MVRNVTEVSTGSQEISANISSIAAAAAQTTSSATHTATTAADVSQAPPGCTRWCLVSSSEPRPAGPVGSAEGDRPRRDGEHGCPAGEPLPDLPALIRAGFLDRETPAVRTARGAQGVPDGGRDAVGPVPAEAYTHPRSKSCTDPAATGGLVRGRQPERPALQPVVAPAVAHGPRTACAPLAADA